MIGSVSVTCLTCSRMSALRMSAPAMGSTLALSSLCVAVLLCIALDFMFHLEKPWIRQKFNDTHTAGNLANNDNPGFADLLHLTEPVRWCRRLRWFSTQRVFKKSFWHPVHQLIASKVSFLDEAMLSYFLVVCELAPSHPFFFLFADSIFFSHIQDARFRQSSRAPQQRLPCPVVQVSNPYACNNRFTTWFHNAMMQRWHDLSKQ